MINLSKGENHVIDKNTQTAFVGLGWDVNANGGDNFDLDASIIMLDTNGKLASDGDVIYFNNKTHKSGAVVHSGDNLTGAGDGDDEVIKVDFSKIPANVSRLVVVVNIYNALTRKQNFGQVNNAFVRLVDTTNGKNEEQLRFDLTEDYSGATGIRMADIYRHNDEWKMKAIGEGAKVASLADFINQFK
jgi:tellurium resistance protein TerD